MNNCKSFFIIVISLASALGVWAGDCGCTDAAPTSKEINSAGKSVVVPPAVLDPSKAEKQILTISGETGEMTVSEFVMGDLSDGTTKNWRGEGLFVQFNPYDEVIERRNAFTKTFRRGEEDFTAVISSGPIHYRDRAGAWQDIHAEFHDKGSEIVSGKNVFETRFPKESAGSFRIDKTEGTLSVSYFKSLRIETADFTDLGELNAPARRARLQNGEIVFSDIDGFGGEVVRVSEIGIEHDLVLDRLPELCRDLPEGAKFLAIDQHITIPEGWNISLRRDPSTMAGKILVVRDSEGKTLFEIPPPLIGELEDRIESVTDSKGESEAVRREQIIGDLRLQKDGDAYTLTTLVPLEWLTAPDRRFPVVIDPTITCYIFTSPADATSSGYSEGTGCYCGYDVCGDQVLATGAETNYGWMFFNVGAIPFGYTINSIAWNAYCYSRNWPYWELRAMSQRTFDCTAYRTSCSSGTTLLTQTWSSSEPTGWKSYTLNASANTILAAQLAYGWFGTGIRDSDGSSSYYCHWYGFYYSSYRPYITVDYTAISCGTTNYGGGNLTISSNTTLGGTHTNIGTFTVNAGVTLKVAAVCKFLNIEANTIVINGIIDANGSGDNGGGGGSGGGFAQGGESSCHGGYGGSGGTSGSGSGGGSGGYSGGTGGCERQDCGFICIGGDDGHQGGGGGAGGGGGGGYGGSGGYGAVGAAGAGFSGASGGTWGSGGSSGSTYGNTTDFNVTWGSGGGGAGGGGGGWSNGGTGGSGGSGGGKIGLLAYGNLTLGSSGQLLANGTAGGAGGIGAGESTNNDYNCSTDGYNGCCFDAYETFDASGGAAGGAGGGSGGGISLMAGGVMSLTGSIQAKGGSGGAGGTPSPSNGACHDWAAGGAGGGGGRIKIIYSSCVTNNLAATIDRNGGSGGTGYVSGSSGSSGSYNTMPLPVTTVTSNPAGRQIIVDGVTYTAPAQFCWLPGTNHSIGTTSPQTSGMNRYTWSSWSDGGAMSHNIVSPYTGTATYTAYFNLEYLIVFEAITSLGTALSSSNYATVTVDGSGHTIWDGSRYSVWVAGGSSHSYSYSTVSSASSSTHRWFCPSPPSGTVSSPDTIRGYYSEQWWFDINENGRSSPCASLEGWYDLGSVTYGCVSDSIVVVGSTRYIFDHWDVDATGTSSSRSSNVTMTAARVARANWRSDYAVTFRAVTTTSGTALSSGNYATVIIDGTPHQIWDGHDYTVYFATGTSHSYSYSWTSSASGSSHRWFCSAPPSGTVTSAATITGNYQEQWWFDIDEGGRSAPCVGREGWYNHGATTTACVTDSIIVAGDTRYIFNSWTGDATGTSSSASNPVTMNAARTAVATWRTEYRLILAYADCGSAIPTQTGAGWYPAGSNPPITTQDPIFDGMMRRYDFVEWTGGTFANPFLSATTILMDAPRTATAYYQLAEVTIVIRTDGTADSVIVDGIRYLSPHTVVWLTGSSHTISTDSIQYDGIDTRYVFAGWADGVSARTRTIAPVSDSTFTANFNTQYYLDVQNGGHGFVTGTGWFYAGSTPSFSSTTEADITARDRWVFNRWIGTGAISYSGTDNPGYCTMNSPITETAVWLRQFKVNIDDGGYGVATPAAGSYWAYQESLFTARITSPDTFGHAYCTGWIGTGSVPATGTDTIVTWSVTDSGTVKWQWSPQLTLTVISEYPGVVPSGTTYYDPGTHITATCPGETLDIAPGHRAIRLGWTATGSAPASGSGGTVDFDITTNTTITWRWRTEYKLTIINPGDHDSPVPTAGEYWCVRDTTIMAWVTSPDGSWYCLGYHGTGSVPPYSPSTYAYFTMTMPSTLTWDWDDLTAVVSLTITSVSDSTWPPRGTYWYRMGSTVVCSTLSDTVFYPFSTDMRYVNLGWTGTGSVPATGSTGHVTFLISTFSTLNWLWQQQVKVTIESEGGYGSPVPVAGEHWFDIGDTVSFSVTSPDGDFWCVGWEGTGSIPSGILDSFVAVLDAPGTLRWLWSDEISRLVVHSDWGTPHPPADTTNFLTGTAVTCTVNAVVPSGPGRRMVCTGWNAIGTGIPPVGYTNTLTWNINGFTELFWLFKQQMSVVVTSAHGSPVPPVGTTWFDSSSTIDASVASPVGDWYCIGWNGTGSAPSGFGTAFSFELEDPATIDWIWERATAGVCTLVVYSPYGHPLPSGTLVVPIGTFIRATVEDSVFDFGWQRCTGWSGTGSVPAIGDSNAVSFTITTNSELTWMWNGQTRWPLTVVSAGGLGDPEPTVGLHWVPDDTVITFHVTSPWSSNICTGWEGAGSVPAVGYDTTFTATIEMPSRVTWLWSPTADVVTLTVVSDFGSPVPHRGVTYHPIGRRISAFVEDTIFASLGIRRLCAGWRGTGSAPATGDSAHFEFTINENTTINWRWMNSYLIDLEYRGCGTGVPTQVGEGWYIQGETAEIESDSIVDVGGGTYYIFIRWEDGPPLPDSFSTSFMVDSTYKVTAVYLRGAMINIMKNPPHTEGYIEIDGIRHAGVDELILWWVFGSSHTISVSDPDTTPTTRHIFNRWSDSGARTHLVGPVAGNMTLIAHYNRRFLIRLEKRPLENVYGRLGFGHMPPVGYYAENWFNEGDTTYIAVSDTDFTPSGNDRYIFDEWSDGGGRVNLIHITEPETLLAQYKTYRKLLLRKNPDQSYGSITVGDTTCIRCSGINRWIENGTATWVSVSPIDVNDANDTVFYFNNFSDGGAVGHTTAAITAPTVLVADYNPVEVNLAICLDADYIDFDTVTFCEVLVTDSSQMIRVSNCGDIAATWGLYISFPGIAWTPGVAPALNKYVVRTVFNNEVVAPPIAFDPIQDYVRSSILWSSPTTYGPGGWNVAPEVEQSMWVQFLSPLNSTYFSNQRIVLTIRAKVYIP